MNVTKLESNVFATIEREEIESLNINNFVSLIHDCRKTMGKSARQRVLPLFSGYDHIPDEVYEIKEIRQWVGMVFEKLPYLLYYISTEGQLDRLLLACIMDVESLFVGEKLSPDQLILEQGVRRLEDLPQIPLKITIPTDRFKKMCKSISSHGKTLNDVQGANKVIKHLEVLVDIQ
ncbi:hypothetical protein M2277_005040 [Paenibacillus sp. LBL]|uniref:hypothetical protein n=1 Tax=Paenibacillus sp. LBL TaxID=2940563 RepID=UPI002473C8B6|nr:hypothetical protein [Paenibacillus sp. LBL]MDH6674348.1 hypothetical protein [Paenibacillus sp. LBL]